LQVLGRHVPASDLLLYHQIKNSYIMKNIFLVALITIGLSASAIAQQKKADGPVMNFKETTIDYGVIEFNSDPYRTFEFTNTGSEPLMIKNAKGSCGCTVPEYSTDPVMPGESGKLKVKYDTKRPGPINKTITVTTNEVGNETRILYIKGEVKKDANQDNVPPASKNILTNPKG
jgi:hypothetical protein